MSHTDLTQLFNNYEPLFNGTNGNNLGQVAIDIVKKIIRIRCWDQLFSLVLFH